MSLTVKNILHTKPYKELLNPLISFETFGTSKLTLLRITHPLFALLAKYTIGVVCVCVCVCVCVLYLYMCAGSRSVSL